MLINNDKLISFNDVNINNFSDYDLDYLRMQIKKNAESLEKSIEKLKSLSSKISSDKELEN
jgi:hypothetical protein